MGSIAHQQQPLADKLTPHQMDRRGFRIARRRTRYEQISTEHAKTRGLAVLSYSVIGRGLLGRLKWLLFGK